MGSSVTTEIRDGRTVAVKRGRSVSDIERLEHEAAVLAAADHPGVVSLLGLERSAQEVVLVTALAGTRSLIAGNDDAASLLAAVAATVADLHDLGVVHGRIDASHIVVAADGHPVLCGFADGGFTADGADPSVDVMAIGALLLEVVDAADAGLARRLRPVAERASSGIASARSVAAALQPALAAAEDGGRDPLGRLGRGIRTAGSTRPDVRVVASGAAVVAALVGAVAAFGTGGGDTSAAPPPPSAAATSSSSSTTTTTTVERAVLVWPPPAGDREVVEREVVEGEGGRYEVGEPGDEVAVGDWDCDGTATPAVLRPATGAVFVFTTWADATIQPTTRVPGATKIRTADADGDGCADVVVETPDGQEVVA